MNFMSANLTPPIQAIEREGREVLLDQIWKMIWFTGLSGSGKATLANTLEIALHHQGKKTFY